MILIFIAGSIWVLTKSKGIYKDGVKNGKLQSKINYKDGHPNGEWIDYYENGQIIKKIYIIRGIKLGWISTTK